MPRAVSEPTLLVRAFTLLLEDAERTGLARVPLLRKLGIDPALLKNPDGRMPLVKFIALARAIVESGPEEPFGVLAGARRTVRDAGLVGYAIAHSATLGDALARLSRYSRIISDSEAVELRVAGESATISLDAHPLRRAIPQLSDRTMAWVVGVAREITATPIAPLAVRFAHPAPRDLKEYRAWFRCPLEFEVRRGQVVFRAADLEKPVVAADSTLETYLDKLATDALKALGSGNSVADRVRRAVWTDLADGPPSLRRVARMLGLSPRTLQRRLAEDDTSFEEVVTGLRRDLAGRLLQQRRLAVYEVAFMLGYSDPSQFIRSFNRWYGVTPRVFRARAS